MTKVRLPDCSPWRRLLTAAIAMLPIAALVPAIAGWAPLWLTTAGVTVPAWLALFAVASRDPGWRRGLALVLLCGMAACLVYDGVRLALTAAGGLRDGIPNIGRMLVGDLGAPTADVASLAYYYRYVGDGGGLALAFLMGRRYGVRAGMIFGAAVCLCLWATLALFPVARALLFPLTPYALAMTLAGHLVYGGVLGWLLDRVVAWGPAAGPGVPGAVVTLAVRETAELPPIQDLTPQALQGS
jgi:hypothetical protein